MTGMAPGTELDVLTGLGNGFDVSLSLIHIFHRLLQQDLAAVGNFVDKVHRRARDLHAARERGLMHPQAIDVYKRQRRSSVRASA